MFQGKINSALISRKIACLLAALLPATGLCSSLVTVHGGDVSFNGGVVSAACSVRSDSQNQVVQMGQVRSNQFSELGAWADPTPFRIYLEDCDTNISQTAGVLFTGISDGKDPTVFKTGFGANASHGIGLGIFDAKGILVVPNSKPLWSIPLNDGETIINYTAKYRATDRKVTSGDASTQVWFSILYQ